MNQKIQDIIKLIEEKDIKMIDFKMVDINGQFRHVTIPVAVLMKALWKKVSASTLQTTATQL